MMIVKEDNSRIIGDFLEINGNIISQRQTSRMPRFISNIRYKYYHNKLVKLVKKFVNSNYALTKNNLIEFFAYINNNFYPVGQYDIVKFVKILNDSENIEACIEFEENNDEYACVITIDQGNPLFELNIKKTSNDNTNNIHINISSLNTKKESCIDIVDTLNRNLLNSIEKYIMSILDAYI